MNILLVEDDEDFAQAVLGEIQKLNIATTRTHARSMTSAIAYLDAEFFDLIILDLKIPTTDGALNESSVHGVATFTHAKASAPGTPILVLTGSRADEHIDLILKYAKQIDVWGEGRQIKMVDFLSKHKLGELPAVLKEFEGAIKQILDIEISGDRCDLTIAELRIIRIFSKSFNAGRCIVSKLSGGLSGSKVYRLHIYDRSGNIVHNAVCKIGSIDAVIDENRRYDQQISRLDPVATPRKLIELLSGAKNTAGIFYGLVQGYPFTGFSLIDQDTNFVNAAITNLECLFGPWRAGESRAKISAIRRRVLNDANFEKCKELITFEWLDQFENQEIQTRWCSTHGDLHGLNILISDEAAPILIDYGDVADGPVSLDPVTLELSLHFHIDGPFRNSSWPTLEQARAWGDLTEYLKDCPNPDFVRACRVWATNAAPGNREIAVCAYAYLFRQLKYENPNIPLITALIEGAKKMYDDTFR